MTEFKRGPGRPPSDEKFVAILLKLPAKLLATLDRERFGDSRSVVVRRFIEQGIKRARSRRQR